MKFINKEANCRQGALIVDLLLEDAWNEDENKYSGANYQGLCRPKYKTGITTLLLEEQNNLCCYCLKEISGINYDTTIEHIIPQNAPENEFDSYLSANELKDNIIDRDKFNKAVKEVPPEKYPHDIAYHNLIASCDSKTHCNNFRGHKLIKPFMYDRDIEQKVIYDALGLVDCAGYQDSFDNIGITNNAMLQRIRRIWKLLSNKLAHINEITEDAIEEEIYTLIDEPQYEKLISDFTGTPSYKAELIKYKWFYTYYRNN